LSPPKGVSKKQNGRFA